MSRLKVDPNELKTVADSLRTTAFQVYGISNKVKNMAQTNERKSINCEYVSSLHSLSDELQRQGKAIYGLATSLERISVIYGDMEERALSYCELSHCKKERLLEAYNLLSIAADGINRLDEIDSKNIPIAMRKTAGIIGKINAAAGVYSIASDIRNQMKEGEPGYSASFKAFEHYVIEQAIGTAFIPVYALAMGAGVYDGEVLGTISKIESRVTRKAEAESDKMYDEYEEMYVKTKGRVPYKM